MTICDGGPEMFCKTAEFAHFCNVSVFFFCYFIYTELINWFVIYFLKLFYTAIWILLKLCSRSQPERGKTNQPSRQWTFHLVGLNSLKVYWSIYPDMNLANIVTK